MAQLWQLIETIENGTSLDRSVVVTFTDRQACVDYMGTDYQPTEGVKFTLEIEPIDHSNTEFDDRQVALAAHLGCSLESINELRHGDNLYDSDDEPGEYLVLTDSEADDAFKASVENYVEECILDQLPRQYRMYFDTEAFTRDVRIGDGRSPSLASYDGAENEEMVDDTWYYIYRVN